ncbi:hypothetical protein [Pseudomonas putida]|uniref:SGNH/GDSL hydrolase family protein n=1 Tax=Pseudomonas putida TaxID=303 RepID=A0A6S5TN20_PSEPU|nr:hypothetical protein [Pseudomonas putida]BBT40867.1 hypothetical protein WP8W18C01_32080 [Pseudomonas putida]
MTIYRKFLWCLPPSLALVASAYYGLFLYQFGAPIQTTYGVADWATFKKQIANSVSGERILLFGDSSSLLGMDTPLLEKTTGRKVVNMALHGGFPLDWVAEFALENARPGDTVVMSLAWTYYFRDFKQPEKWMLDQIVAWDHQYFYDLDTITKARFIAGLDINSLVFNINTKINKKIITHDFPDRRTLTDDEVRERWSTSHSAQPFSYSFLNISQHGDLQGACGNPEVSFSSFKFPAKGIQPNAFELLEETAKKMKAKGIRFLMTPSISLADEASQDDNYRKVLQEIMTNLKKREIEIAGTPDDFYFSRSDFYDTNFHLNCEASSKRTLKLYEAIKDSI